MSHKHRIRSELLIKENPPWSNKLGEILIQQGFLEEASQDPKVRAIKMTFYRTSEDSRAIRFLMDAARNGKQVAVVMEPFVPDDAVEAASDEELAVAFELETAVDLPVIANLEVLERLLALEEGRS